MAPYTTEDLRQLWQTKVTKNIPLTEGEKVQFIDAYYMGKLPPVRGDYDLGQWVEDGMKSFDGC